MSHPETAARTVRQRLRTMYARRLAATVLDRLGLALLAAATAMLTVGIARLWGGEPPFAAAVAWNLFGAALCGVTIYTLGSLPEIDDAAGWIDRRAGTHDRFHTALEFAARPELTAMQTLTLAECAGYIDRFPVRRWTPIRMPRTFAFVAVPLVSLALLAWHASLGLGQSPHDPALAAAVTQRAATLQKIADRLHRDDGHSPSPELEKIAEALKRSAEKLRDSQRQTDEQKLKTALGELSSLQGMLAAMKQAARDEKISPGELAALAAALAANDPSKTTGEAIKQGQLAQAGDQLEKLAEQMKARGADAAQALQELAQSMQEQTAKLSEQEKNEVARQMQQAAQAAQNGQGELSAQAMQRLAELLKRAGKNGAGRQASGRSGASGSPMSQQQLQDLLNALENAKDGLQPDGQGQASGSPGDAQEGGQSLAMVESFSKPGGDPPGGEKPSGMPGSEHDRGTNDHLLADRAMDAPKEAGRSKRLDGVLGEGASLQELVGAASGPARAGRPYRELYEAIAPAEQNSVEQENIPLGSRFFVRRYFENIRPQN